MALSKYVDVLKQWSEPAVSWAADHPRLALGLAVSGLSAVFFIQGRLREPRLPPGPRRWPLIGSLPSLTDKFHEDIMRMKEIHGDVFTIWMGTQPYVVLTTYDTIKEVFLTRGTDFAGRPDYDAITNEFKDEMFTAPYNETFAKNKKFALTSLRTLGGVKAAADGAIMEEIAVLINKLQSSGKKAVDINDVVALTTTNIMSGMMFNERMDHDDPKLIEFKNLVLKFYEVLNDYSVTDLLLPGWMTKIINSGKNRRFKNIMDELRKYVAKRVEEHQQTLDPANPRDFIDMYLMKPDMKMGVAFYDTMIAFLPDAIDSVAIFMRWIVLYLAHHPDVQKKVQAEIDKVVGPSQMVNVSHRSQLKYTDAAILEVMRCSDSSTNTTAHTATKPGLTFRGYDMRPSVSVMGSIVAVNRDPKLFPDPEKFNPERFLNENGDLVNANHVIPFSLGRRMCLGESLTKLELFIFTANVMHTFNIRFPDGEEKPCLMPAGGMIQYPVPFKVIFEPRD